MESDRALVLALVLVVAAVVGAATRVPASGHLPQACPKPAWRQGIVVCDGEGRDLGGRAPLLGLKLDVNQVTSDDLQRIAGIGPALAARILAERQARGRFTAIDELDDVSGVGPRMLATLRAHLEVRP
jgi:competence protein ComEA